MQLTGVPAFVALRLTLWRFRNDPALNIQTVQ
jgi:hypothetical protein